MVLKRLGVKSKRWPTVSLALIGIAVTVAYMVACAGSCTYLKGDLLGMDLKYLGIFYMAAILLLSLLRLNRLCLLLLAFGIGGELFLVGYQIRSGIFCPYCLAFAATVLTAFAVNYDRVRKGLAALAAGCGLVFFLLFFSGSATPAYAAALPSTTFGTGAVEIRIYTDYFCGPCRGEEAEVMALLTELVEKKIVRVTFIDTPIHRETVFYAGYFLAGLNAKRNWDFRQVVALRKALFDAAGEKILEKEPLELFLKKKGIAFQLFDPMPVYKIYSNYIKEDKINATPSCVVLSANGKQTLVGRDDTVNALRGLLK